MDSTIQVQLGTFTTSELLPHDEAIIRLTLQSPLVQKIICFALGPRGNNIEQACEQWIDRLKLRHKTEVELGDTPVICLERAREVSEKNTVAIFWTCAVYYDLHNLFFTNPDVLPFFITHVMPLDEMQLATRPENASFALNGQLPTHWSVAAHPSPAPLVRHVFRNLEKAKSNAHAAQMCSVGAVDACITTETARRLYGLEKIHSFGSPPMVFFGGITAHGARIIRLAYSAL